MYFATAFDARPFVVKSTIQFTSIRYQCTQPNSKSKLRIHSVWLSSSYNSNKFNSNSMTTLSIYNSNTAINITLQHHSIQQCRQYYRCITLSLISLLISVTTSIQQHISIAIIPVTMQQYSIIARSISRSQYRSKSLQPDNIF